MDTNSKISLVALFIALLALIATIYDGYATRKHNRLSVEPHLSFNYHYNNVTDGWTLTNRGLGPAIIIWFEVYYDEEPMPDWGALAEKLELSDGDFTFSNLAFHRIISSNQSTTLFILTNNDEELTKKLRTEYKRITMTTCYCSLYWDCKIKSWGEPISETKDCQFIFKPNFGQDASTIGSSG